MDRIVADTHTTIWHFASPEKLSRPARKIMANAERNGTIFVSVLTLIEIIYLVERKRIDKKMLSTLRHAIVDSTSAFMSVDVDTSVISRLEKISRHQVPEMPDRIIAATALYLKLPLVTKDAEIRSATNVETIW